MTRIIARNCCLILAVMLSCSAAGYGGFELGWHWRGDDIYGGAYKLAYDNPANQELAERIAPKKEVAHAGVSR